MLGLRTFVDSTGESDLGGLFAMSVLTPDPDLRVLPVLPAAADRGDRDDGDEAVRGFARCSTLIRPSATFSPQGRRPCGSLRVLKRPIMTIKFAAIGLNHSHIYGQVDCLLREGAELVSFHSPEDDLAAGVCGEVSAGEAGGGPAGDPRGPVHRAGAHRRDPRRAGRHLDRGDAARQGRDERQAGDDLARAARRDQAGAEGDRADLLGLLFRALRDALDGAGRRAGARPGPSARWCTPWGWGRMPSATTSGRTGSSTASAMAASSPISARTSASSSCSSPVRSRAR